MVRNKAQPYGASWPLQGIIVTDGAITIDDLATPLL